MRVAGVVAAGSRWLAIGTIVLAPLPLGSVSPVFSVFWSGALLISLATARMTNLRAVHYLMMWTIAGTFLVLILIIWLQSLHDPSFAKSYSGWQDASRLLGIALPRQIAATGDAAIFRVVGPLAFALALLRALILAAEAREARRLANIMAVTGICYAAFALISFVADPDVVLWQEKIAYRENVTGSFINRNTAATFFGGCACVWMVRMLAQARELLHGERATWSWLRSLIAQPERVSRRLILSSIGFFLCFAVTAATGSRAGLLLTASVMSAIAVIFFRDSLSSWRSFAAIGSLILIGLLSLLQILGGSVANRLQEAGLHDEGRLHVYRATLRMIADHPWFGVGLGGFEAAFPIYRPAEVSDWGVWDRAHSVPLQIAAELGIPFALLIVLLAALTVVALFATMFRGKASSNAISLEALAFVLLGVIHSTVDFSLQIPGYGIFFAGWMGVGLASAIPARGSAAVANTSRTAGRTEAKDYLDS